MDAALKIWIVIGVVGLLNYLSRLSFIAVFARRRMPSLLARALKYVPAAMLTALIVPMITAEPAAAHALAGHPKVFAAALAGVVAFFTRSNLATLGTGMAALWALQAIG
jgi:branched-subunit amino acid transport protein